MRSFCLHLWAKERPPSPAEAGAPAQASAEKTGQAEPRLSFTSRCFLLPQDPGLARCQHRHDLETSRVPGSGRPCTGSCRPLPRVTHVRLPESAPNQPPAGTGLASLSRSAVSTPSACSIGISDPIPWGRLKTRSLSWRWNVALHPINNLRDCAQ